MRQRDGTRHVTAGCEMAWCVTGIIITSAFNAYYIISNYTVMFTMIY